MHLILYSLALSNFILINFLKNNISFFIPNYPRNNHISVHPQIIFFILFSLNLIQAYSYTKILNVDSDSSINFLKRQCNREFRFEIHINIIVCQCIHIFFDVVPQCSFLLSQHSKNNIIYSKSILFQHVSRL